MWGLIFICGILSGPVVSQVVGATTSTTTTTTTTSTTTTSTSTTSTTSTTTTSTTTSTTTPTPTTGVFYNLTGWRGDIPQDELHDGTYNEATDCPKALIDGDTVKSVAGCFAENEISLIENDKIVAGRIYDGVGNDMALISCKLADIFAKAKEVPTDLSKVQNFRISEGFCTTWYAETSGSSKSGKFGFSTAFVNPGCKLYIFHDHDFKGAMKLFGPGRHLNPEIEGAIGSCDGIPCIGSMLWTCKQVFPTCKPTDAWQTLTELDNSQSMGNTKFPYTTTVGTTFSQEMIKSLNVKSVTNAMSNTAAEPDAAAVPDAVVDPNTEAIADAVLAAFWRRIASLGVSATTGHDWTKTDTKTKGDPESFKVNVEVPAGVKMSIEVAVGSCGGSTIYTQRFRVVDSKTKRPVKTWQGEVEEHSLSREDFF